MASLHAKHSRRCAVRRAWTRFDEALTGCTCPDGPFYYVVVREGEHAHKEAVGRDRQQAEISLRNLADAVDDGRFRPRPTIGFSEWADHWLESFERKPSTVGSYRSTIAHAKQAFGSQRVRRIGAEDIARFNSALRERGCSPSTRCEAPSGSRRLPAGSRLLPLCGLQRRSRIAARAETSAGTKGGRVFRERGATEALRTPPVRAVQDVVLGCPQDRDAAGRAARASLGRR